MEESSSCLEVTKFFLLFFGKHSVLGGSQFFYHLRKQKISSQFIVFAAPLLKQNKHQATSWHRP